MQRRRRRTFRSFFSSLILILFISLFCRPLALSAAAAESLSDEALLDKIAEHIFRYFAFERNPRTGLVRDRASNFQNGNSRGAASIAATGFALTAYPVGVERGWMDRGTAYSISQKILDFFLNKAPHERGFFYHFMDMETGRRSGRSELSPIDTALFLAGVLFAGEYFEDPVLKELTAKIYERVDWPWMLHGGETFALSWSPEEGFSRKRWDHYDESMILYLLAIGSPTHPIPASSWKAVARPVGSYGGYRTIVMPPLFTHQYSHIWIDFRGRHDGFADYFQNSVQAALANRAFCIDQSSRFKSYGPDAWGLTASDGPFGYRAYGAPPGWAQHDGTLAPTGCGGSIVFTPEESLRCLRYFYENLGDSLWGKYGFSDAFNLDKKWFGKDVIGIDQGALLLMIENYRTGLIWKVMGRHPAIQKAMRDVGFRPGSIELPWPDPPEYRAPYIRKGVQVDGYLKDWPPSPVLLLNGSHKEFGTFTDDKDLSGRLRFVWDEEALYFSAVIVDDSVLLKRTGKNIWQDDLLELYIDPEDDGLRWYHKTDFQIGFHPHPQDESVDVWSWFQGGENPLESGMVQAAGYSDERGYVIEGSVRWFYLGVRPEAGMRVRISPALHDIDQDRSEGKLQWFFRNEDELHRFVLGVLVLEK